MADTTVTVGNSNKSSLPLKLEAIGNNLASISQLLTILPLLKRGIEEPDNSKTIKKIKKNIKDLQLKVNALIEGGIEEDSEEEITEELIADILVSYLKIADFANKLKTTLLSTTLNDSQIQDKIVDIVPTLNEDNYYTKGYIDTLLNECLKELSLTDLLANYATTESVNSALSNYVTNSNLNSNLNNYYTKTESDTAFEPKGEVVRVIADLLNTSTDTVTTLNTIKELLTEDNVQNVLDIIDFKEKVNLELADIIYIEETNYNTGSGEFSRNYKRDGGGLIAFNRANDVDWVAYPFIWNELNMPEGGTPWCTKVYKISGHTDVFVDLKLTNASSGLAYTRLGYFCKVIDNEITDVTEIAIDKPVLNSTSGIYKISVPGDYTHLLINYVNGSNNHLKVYYETITGNKIKNLQDLIDNLQNDDDGLVNVLFDQIFVKETAPLELVLSANHYLINANGGFHSIENNAYTVNIYSVSKGDEIVIDFKSCPIGSTVQYYLLCGLYSNDLIGGESDFYTESFINPLENNIRYNKGYLGTYKFTVPDGVSYLAIMSNNTSVYKYTGNINSRLDSIDNTTHDDLSIYYLKVNGDKYRITNALLVAYNNAGNELIYGFSFMKATLTPTLKYINYRKVNRNYSYVEDLNVDKVDKLNGSTRIVTGASTDLISPIDIKYNVNGVTYNNFMGGNHNINSVETKSLTVLVDGKVLNVGDTVTGNKLEYIVENLIGVPVSGGNKIPLIEETIVYTVIKNLIRVNVKHKHISNDPYKIKVYYGMQYACPSTEYKMFIPKTPVGHFFERLEARRIANTLTKKDYPNFNKFVTKLEKPDSDWYTECWINPNVGIGDHSMLQEDDTVMVMANDTKDGVVNNAKSYHRLIENYDKPANEQLEYEWEGVYTFKCEDDTRSVQNYYSNLSI